MSSSQGADIADEGTIGAISTRRIAALLVFGFATVLGFSAGVGFWGAQHGVDFDWLVAATFGTALGTTLLALATFWLGLSTHQDVRASQRTAILTAQQVELSRAANELARSEQEARLAPAVIGSARGGSASGERGEVNVELVNAGGGPAVGVRVRARYFLVSEPMSNDPAVRHVAEEELPYLASGEKTQVKLLFVRGERAPGGINYEQFLVGGEYLNRRGQPAGQVIDWKHEDLATYGA